MPDITITAEQPIKLLTHGKYCESDIIIETLKLFAAIGVIYPSGTVLTCTKGSKMLTAKNTSGQWVFAIPEAGTWTVSITGGPSPVSKTVEITSEGQCVNVELNYWDGSSLYTSGNEHDEITGGWAVFGDATKTSNYLNTICNPNSDAGAYTKRKIDLTGYNNLNFTITNIKTDWFIWLTDTKPTSVETSYESATTKYQAETNGTGSLDISAINSEVYIAVGDYSTSNNSYGAHVTRIWLS